MRGDRRSVVSGSPPEPHSPSSRPNPGLTSDEDLSETLLIFDDDLISSIVRQCTLVDGENSLLTNVLKHVPDAKVSAQARAWRRFCIHPSILRTSHSLSEPNCVGGDRWSNF